MAEFKRDIAEEAKLLSKQFRSLSIVGPRQSGKTTLSKSLFPLKPYITFEDPVIQAEAEANMESFLRKFPDGAILDEAQRVPLIFRYLQGILDKNKARGQFILTGSNNFLLQENISQSLAGRMGYLQLLPLSFGELSRAGLGGGNLHKFLLTGGYPEIWDQDLIPAKWYSGYVQTYVQRDVRQLRNITNLGVFNRFIQLCASHAGQILNREELARATGVDTKTIHSWLGILESSFIIFLLQPWYNNLKKRIVKSPKLYFFDTGILCYLLGISSQASLQKHPLYGGIFENWIITEIQKNRFNQGIPGGLYYLRDSLGNELDLIVEKKGAFLGVEIKGSGKMDPGMLSGLRYWLKSYPEGQGILVHGGTKGERITDQIRSLSWKEIAQI
ncbi:MAG TPA: ATP-binding protein [Chitinophagaceae bacterium]|nr:ATP-binding protein [Chitinophagaceae bacterium]